MKYIKYVLKIILNPFYVSYKNLNDKLDNILIAIDQCERNNEPLLRNCLLAMIY